MVVRRLGNALWWTTAAVIVVLAVALSAARLLLPGMSEYREQVVGLVEEAIHRQVEIGAMDAAWHRFSPVLRLKQVVIHDRTFPGGRLDIGEIQVGLDIIDSLVRRKWLTSGIRIIGLQLSLQTDLSSPSAEPKLEAFYWLMRQKSVSLEQVSLDWRDPGLLRKPVQFSALSAQLKSDGWRHQLLIQSGVNAFYGKRIVLAADLSGPLKWPQDWRGTTYIRTTGFHLSSLPDRLEHPVYAAQGDVDLEVWARLRNRAFNWSAGSIDIARLRVQRRDEAGIAYAADRLSSHFSLHAMEGGWNLDLRKFSITRDDSPAWPETRFRATVKTGEALSVRGTVSHVAVSETAKLLPLLPWLDAQAREQLRQMQPQGELTDTEFEMRFADNAAPQISLRSGFEHLGLSSQGGLPGATGLSGRLEGNLLEGYLDLDTDSASLQLPKVFSEVIDVSRLTGRLAWRRLADRFRVSSERLLLVSRALQAQTRLQFDFLPGQAAPWVDMQLSADSFPMDDVKHFLPDRVMRPKALKWLRGAFRGGMAHNVRFLLQGPLNHVPFDHGDGRLEVRFDFNDVLLDYHPLWGQLDTLDGSALFEGRSMRITGDSARILDAHVDRAVAVIEDFAHPVLTIDGTVSGTLESLLAYINESPLQKKFGKLVDQVSTRGDAGLQLDLRIPLHPGLGELAVNGTVDFLGNELKPNDSDISLDAVRGELKFTRRGVSAQDVSARLFSHPVKVSVYPQGSADKPLTIVDIEGNLELVSMLEKESAQVAPYLDGAAYWHALLKIPMGGKTSEHSVILELRSDLKGVSVDLPAPFAKAADEVCPAVIRWAPGKLSSQPLMIQLDDALTLRLLMREGNQGLRKAGIHFGEGVASLPLSDEIHLDGWLDLLDLDAWVDLLREAARRGALTSSASPPVSTDLHIRQLSLLGYLAEGLNVSSQAQAPWRFTIGGRDMAGQAGWTPAAGELAPTLAVRLERLTAVRLPAAGEPADKVVLTPERLPNLDLDIGELQLGPYALGKVVVRGKRVPEGMVFPGLQVDAAAIAFNGEGAWLQNGAQQSTRFRADITGGELGELVKLFGDRGVIQGGKMQGYASLDWPGNPADFSLANVEGKITLKTGKGRLVEVREGAGKLLNLFNLNSLQRRLSLDFTDLTKEGFSFDKIKGSLVISDGNAYTEDFVIYGTSATIEISGRTGLAARDYDQLIKVTPQVSSSLPLAGALAGGPAVGAAVFLAERLVGKNFNRMAQVRYKVTGSWDKPVYTRLKPEADPEPPAEDAAAETAPPAD